MTRDEAIKAAHKRGFHSSVDAWISLFVDIGMLKLDEPKSARDKFQDAMRAFGFRDESRGFKEALSAFDASQK